MRVEWSFEDPRSVRRAAGRSHRAEVPLEELAEPPSLDHRPDPIEILTSQDRSRTAELVPIRHGRMSATPFTFYRGAAAVMASDLSRAPATGIRPQICGDAHLSNFGVFNGPDRRLVFDLNDFDETLPGPFEWDVKRLAASVSIAARHNDLDEDATTRATTAAVAGYRDTVARAAEISPLDLHYLRLEMDRILASTDVGDKRRRKAEKAMAKASRKNSLRALDRLTAVQDGRRKIIADPPLIIRLEGAMSDDELETLGDFFRGYVQTLPPYRQDILMRYRVTDIAHKVVGVGSVGTRCLIALLVSGDDEPLFLQFKEATTSVLEPYAGASEYGQSGERVVQGQRLMQAASDDFLGWSRYDSSDGRSYDFYLRQLWDGKGSADVEDMGPKRLRRYAYNCGGALALAHARSGDPALISGYVGDDPTFDHAIADFAACYADLNDSDHAAHTAAINDGQVEAVRDI